ncbi:S8 family serine peptidase [Streptomyces tubbatahanensis]|uniref:S8 family serine peptidase n=1 Tax=Streptomyces tubbatahanensis TaxID=2923272 RepID=A0ABY3XZE6_9ACTN|nr:S8 family serine peptidase [Streptomyces tubbatahanensis]UNS99929.1 S8 family serine peptidase [Streptomyces tubbatahanensis]
MTHTKVRRAGLRVGTSFAAAGISALLCVGSATPAQAKTPASWESEALGLSSAQKTTRGKGVRVAVLDSGVVKDHPAVAGKVTTGPDYVKDGLHSGDPQWGEHGTAMASDVLKVAPESSILSVRVIDDKKDNDGDLTSGPSPVAQGITYAVDHGADVISMSLGGETFGSSFDEQETKALAHAAHKGVPVIASAGNEGDMFNDSSYPAGYPSVIAVAAVEKGGSRAEFSTVRTYNTIAAPGVGIVSAKNTGGYAPVNGTSPAAALTSGVVALMLGKDAELKPSQVRAILTSTAAHPPGGYNPLVGHGVVNAAAAVRAVSDPPADGAAPAGYQGKTFLTPPNGVEPTQHPPLDTTELTIGLVGGGVGLLMVVGAVLLGRAGRRRAATVAGSAGPVAVPHLPTPTGGPAGPGHSGPA